tara:strand:+ start:1797 stop:3605 length:1809 start_codon:yes stop_codon:yes gene_type:complete
MGITKVNKNLIGDSALDSDKIANNSIGSDEILDNTITNADISPQASISASKLNLPGSATDLLNGAGGFGQANVEQADTNNFNIGVLGFKMAVNEGLTVFNLKDGVVDEFNDESGIDTAENSNVTYDSSSDFYSGGSGFIASTPPTQNIFSFLSTGPHTYTVETGVTNVNVLIVGGGGGGGPGGYNRTKGGGAGAGGLIYYPNYPVTPGGTVAVTVGAGGQGGGYNPPSPGSAPYTPTARPDGRVGNGEFGGYEHPQFNYPGGHTYYSPGETGNDSSFGPLIGEGGGAGGGYLTAGSHPYMGGVTGPQYHGGGSGGAAGGSGSGYTPGSAGETSTQTANHPIPLTPTILPVNSPGSFGNDGGVNQTDSAPYFGSSGGGGAGGAGGDAEGTVAGEGGIGLYYNIADGTTSVGYAGGGAGANDSDFPQGTSVVFGGGDTNPSPHQQSQFFPGLPGAVNSGGGGAGGRNTPPYPQPAGGAYGGDGGSGIVVVKEIQGTISDTSTTLVSDTFTANSVPTKARIVVFAEINSALNSELTASATRDNTTFNAITLTDSGYVTGSSGTKIFTGSTPLTGTASPQVQVRWKIVGAGLSHINTIHGVSLQWA